MVCINVQIYLINNTNLYIHICAYIYCHVSLTILTIEGVWIGDWIHWPLIYSQLVTTSNYSAIASLHSLKMTRAHGKYFPTCSVCPSRFLVTASSTGDSSASEFTPFSAGYRLINSLVAPNCPAYNTSARIAQKTPLVTVVVELLLVKNLLPSSELRLFRGHYLATGYRINTEGWETRLPGRRWWQKVDFVNNFTTSHSGVWFWSSDSLTRLGSWRSGQKIWSLVISIFCLPCVCWEVQGSMHFVGRAEARATTRCHIILVHFSWSPKPLSCYKV
jgi:hypothetical protein